MFALSNLDQDFRKLDWLIIYGSQLNVANHNTVISLLLEGDAIIQPDF